jgi:2-polyprenyl-3-methyl-5-hydroxy-6-metoxy-1,4-benzoquinol methylase
MNYEDHDLQNHELDFWINSYTPPFFHFNFYNSFFNFSELSGKKTIDIGCGGAPISDYCGVSNIDLTIVDPLIDDLLKHKKYEHLKNYNHISRSLFDLDNSDVYEYLVCLNVIDHFNDDEYGFVDKFHDLISDEGYMWLYFDVRNKNDENHLLVDKDKILKKIESKFEIVNISYEINPTHKGWSSVNESIRIVAKKK